LITSNTQKSDSSLVGLVALFIECPVSAGQALFFQFCNFYLKHFDYFFLLINLFLKSSYLVFLNVLGQIVDHLGKLFSCHKSARKNTIKIFFNITFYFQQLFRLLTKRIIVPNFLFKIIYFLYQIAFQFLHFCFLPWGPSTF